ncbi:hypothetical protein ACLB1N_32135 [Escherichia coli]
MGDTGPCGPCTESPPPLRRPHSGWPSGSPQEDGDCYIEIGNIVFMYEPPGRWHDGPAAEAVCRYRYGSGAHCCGAEHVNSNDHTSTCSGRHSGVKVTGRTDPQIAGGESLTTLFLCVPDRGWRNAVERKPWLCTASYHSSRSASH